MVPPVCRCREEVCFPRKRAPQVAQEIGVGEHRALGAVGVGDGLQLFAQLLESLYKFCSYEN